MYFFADTMVDLANYLKLEEGVTKYTEHKNAIKVRLSNFFDKTDNIPKDIVAKTSRNGAPRMATAEPSNHFGYPNILPIAFGMLDSESE